jgi:hypothetical protein
LIGEYRTGQPKKMMAMARTRVFVRDINSMTFAHLS